MTHKTGTRGQGLDGHHRSDLGQTGEEPTVCLDVAREMVG